MKSDVPERTFKFAVEKEALIEKLQLAVGSLERVEQQKAYKQGLKDGVRLRSRLEAAASFEYGFKLGALLMLEVLTGKGELVRGGD